MGVGRWDRADWQDRETPLYGHRQQSGASSAMLSSQEYQSLLLSRGQEGYQVLKVSTHSIGEEDEINHQRPQLWGRGAYE